MSGSDEVATDDMFHVDNFSDKWGWVSCASTCGAASDKTQKMLRFLANI
jgi:hypothetical protein